MFLILHLQVFHQNEVLYDFLRKISEFMTFLSYVFVYLGQHIVHIRYQKVTLRGDRGFWGQYFSIPISTLQRN